MLQNLPNLVYLGDDFQTFSHLSTQNLAQSSTYQNISWHLLCDLQRC